MAKVLKSSIFWYNANCSIVVLFGFLFWFVLVWFGFGFAVADLLCLTVVWFCRYILAGWRWYLLLFTLLWAFFKQEQRIFFFKFIFDIYLDFSQSHAVLSLIISMTDNAHCFLVVKPTYNTWNKLHLSIMPITFMLLKLKPKFY